jgi:anti-sigma regulatory factor (Ser/Thr protein kinase)
MALVRQGLSALGCDIMTAPVGVSGEPLMVLCSTCGDAIAEDSACPTCGEVEPRAPHPDPAMRLDEALLYQVGVALSAQARLATRSAVETSARASRLRADLVVLRGRLRTQAVLLQRLVMERPRMAPAVDAALDNVEKALQQPDTPASGAFWGWSVRARLPRDVTCASVARRLLGEYVREHLDPVAADDALWVVSELANNAFLHGEGAIRLYIERFPDRLRIEVLDDGQSGRIESPDDGQSGRIESPVESGAAGEARGLFVVDRLAMAWGTMVNGTGHVWADMSIG